MVLKPKALSAAAADLYTVRGGASYPLILKSPGNSLFQNWLAEPRKHQAACGALAMLPVSQEPCYCPPSTVPR